MAGILLTFLINAELCKVSSMHATICWILLSVVLFEVGNAIRNLSFKYQGFLLIIASYIRILFQGDFFRHTLIFGVNGQIAAYSVIAVFLYYYYFRLRYTEKAPYAHILDIKPQILFNYMSPIALVSLLFLEIQPLAWVPPALACLTLTIFLTGTIVRERHMLYQTLLLTLISACCVLSLDFPLHGRFSCRVASPIVIGIILVMRIIWRYLYENNHERIDIPAQLKKYIWSFSSYLFSAAAFVLLTIFIPLELFGPLSKYMTLALACDGFLFMIIGLIIGDRFLRFSSLGLLCFCVVKVFYDLWILDIERVYKVMALIGLGMILIVIGLIYSRYREKINQLISK